MNIKVEQSVDKAAMDVSGDGTTKVELDGQNVLDSYRTQYPAGYRAGLRKQGEGTLIITDETNNEGKKITTPKSESDTSGSLTAKGAGGNGAAGIGGSAAEGTKNIIIEGYATVDAAGPALTMSPPASRTPASRPGLILTLRRMSIRTLMLRIGRALPPVFTPCSRTTVM